MSSCFTAFFKFRESDILEELTPRLRAEVTNFANQDTVHLLKKMKLFEGMEESIVTKLIISLRSSFLPPNEIVCVAGEIGRHLYIIRKGIFEVGTRVYGHMADVHKADVRHTATAVLGRQTLKNFMYLALPIRG